MTIILRLGLGLPLSVLDLKNKGMSNPMQLQIL